MAGYNYIVFGEGRRSLADGTETFVRRWEKCIAKEGDYVEM